MSLSTTMSLSSSHFPILATPGTYVGSNAKNKVPSRPHIIFEEKKDRIKKMFDKVELSVSSYDTAWVAMIPSPSSPQDPLFPQCLNWLLENQLNDGSWGPPDRHELFTKDSLLSTFTCVLALKQWGVGEQQTNRGLEYIESKISSVHDDKQHSPIGFDIIFSNLIEDAQNLDLNLHVGEKHLEALIRKRELELKRGWRSNSEGWKAYIAYISEGMGRSQNWEIAMKYQRKNGSLFSSPATTAAAFTHVQNANCLNYLLSLLEQFGNAVPTLHPLDVYTRIYMVDNLEILGIDRHFKEEIQSVLDETYSLWKQEDENIFLEPTACALAFRLLRLHGYDVSSEALIRFSEDKFNNTLQGYLKDVGAVLELHKASQIVLQSDDSVLVEQNIWTGQVLEEYLSSSKEHANKPFNNIDHEVRFALRFPHHTYLDRILNRRMMEHYEVDQKRILKTSYRSLNLANKEFLELAVEDFNHCQLIIREEFEQYNRWFMESGMDKLPYFPITISKVGYAYLTAAATHVSPELSEARLSWAKNGLLICATDDCYDVWDCEEDHTKLIQLMEKWDVDINKECCSETVKILFLALKSTICEIEDQAFKVQGRSVLNHLIQLWVDALRAFLQEAEWLRSKYVPTIDEYLPNSLISSGMGPLLLPGLYLVGPKLPQETIESDEYNHLWKLLSLYFRLLNDINGRKREIAQGKLNSLAIQVIHGSGAVTEEEIIKKTWGEIDEIRKEILRCVLQEEGSIVPREVKDVFWKMTRTLHVIYKKEDVIHAKETPDELFSIKDAVLSDPIILK